MGDELLTGLKTAIADFTALVKTLVAMLTNFIDSWKKEITFTEPTTEATEE